MCRHETDYSPKAIWQIMNKISWLIKNIRIHSPRQISELIKNRIKRIIVKTGLGTYYCKALIGESDYNICINSEMTVLCNRRDYDASGQIGVNADFSLF